MAFRRLHTLHEVERHGYWLEARCPECGRQATFSPRALINGMHPPYDLRSVAGRLVCYDPPGCGHRGALVKAAEALVSPDKIAARPLATTDDVPAGVEPTA